MSRPVPPSVRAAEEALIEAAVADPARFSALAPVNSQDRIVDAWLAEQRRRRSPATGTARGDRMDVSRTWDRLRASTRRYQATRGPPDA